MFEEWLKKCNDFGIAVFPKYMMECHGHTTEPHHPQLQVVPTNIEFAGATNENNIASNLFNSYDLSKGLLHL